MNPGPVLEMRSGIQDKRNLRYLRRVLPYLRPYRKLAVLSVMVMILSALIGLTIPWPLKFLVDNVLGNEPVPGWLKTVFPPATGSTFALMLFTVAAGFTATLVFNGLNVAGEYVNTRVQESVTLDFRSDLFQHAQRLSLSFHEHRRAGMTIYALNFQAAAAARVILTVPNLGQSVLTLVGMFWITLEIDRQLGLLSLTVVPFLYYSVRYYINHIQDRLLGVKRLEGQTISIIHEAMSMLRVIVAFGRQPYEYERFRRQGEGARDARVDVTVRQTLFSLFVNTVTAAGTALVMGFGAVGVLRGRLTTGQVLVVMAYLASAYGPLESISATIGSLQNEFVALKIAFRLLDTAPEIKDARDAVDIDRGRGDISFDGVHFSHRERKDTLFDISFEAKAGELIGIVGPTGAGKTTVLSLIPRFYEPQGGRILVDGRDIRTVTLRSLREQVSMVLQEPLLFSGTIADNIRYGRLEAGMDDIVQAAKAANAHDFIVRLRQQYETELGERGARLSMGERQRVSIARAFLRDAPILILDEPTSSVDSKTEAIILGALDRLMKGRTTLMVAHRLSTLSNAGRILVLDRGRLVQQGTHEELLGQEGLYRQLHQAQTRRMAPRGRAKASITQRHPVGRLAMALTDADGAARDAARQQLSALPSGRVMGWARRLLESDKSEDVLLAAAVAKSLSLSRLAPEIVSRATRMSVESSRPLVEALTSFGLRPARMVGLLSKDNDIDLSEAIGVLCRVYGWDVLPHLRALRRDAPSTAPTSVLEAFSQPDRGSREGGKRTGGA